MKNKIVISLTTLGIFIAGIFVCAKINNKVKFDGRVENIDNLSVVNQFDEDFNNDKVIDKLVFYGNNDSQLRYPTVEAIILYDGKTNEVLTSIKEKTMMMNVIGVVDINQDKVKDIIFGDDMGNYGIKEDVYIYKDGTFKHKPLKMNTIDIEPLDNFMVKVTEKNTLKKYTINIPTKKIGEYSTSRYGELPLYNEYGKVIKLDAFGYVKGAKDEVRDIDDDGKVEYIKKDIICGLYQADSLYMHTEIYKFIDGEFVLIDMQGEELN